MSAEMVLKNGVIYSLDGKKAESLAISEGKVKKIGSDKEVESLIGEDTYVIDLKGKAVVPGFNDTHVHLVGYGAAINAVDLNGVSSIDELITKCKDFIDEKQIDPGKWVYGRGWNQNLFVADGKRFPTNEDLDKISTEHPILLIRVCGHIGLSNSKALQNVGITEDTFIAGGSFDKNSAGKPNGIIREASLEWYKKNIVPKPSLEDIKISILSGAQELLKWGVTSIHSEDSYDLGYGGDFMDIYKAYKELETEGRLPLRVYQKVSLPKHEDIEKFLKTGLRTGDGSNFYKIGPVKQWCDGTMGARTAALTEGYSDDPENRGILVYEEEELYQNILLAHNSGMQVCLHAIGDRALSTVLNAYERVISESNLPHRHRIVHCQVGNLGLYEKLARLGISINIQPLSTASDLNMMNSRLGSDREKESHNWRTITDLGVCISASSDVPVELPNVFYGIHAIVNRKDLNDKPKNGWLPEQAVTVEEALKMYTINSAWNEFEEEIKGTLTEGKLADMVILDKDPLMVDSGSIKDIRVLATLIDGKIMYGESNI